MNNENVRKLTDRETVRLNPNMYGDSDDIIGTQQTLKEIVNNTVDLYLKNKEYNKVEVSYSPKDNWYSVRDYGQGLPVEWNEEAGDYNYNLVMFTLNAGTNYDNITEDVVTIGKHGVGLSFSIMSCEEAYVEIIKEKTIYEFFIEEGKLVKENKCKNTLKEKCGTYIKIKPSNEVFTDINIPEEWVKNYLKEQTVTNKGLRITYINADTREETEYYYEKGIIDYIEELSEGNRFTDIYSFETEYFSSQDTPTRPKYQSQYNIAYTFVKEGAGIYVFHNSSPLTDRSSQHEALELATVYTFDKILKEEKKYNKNESKINFNDISENLLVIINTYSTYTSYKGQTKRAVSNKFIKDKLNELLREQLKITYVENKLEFNIVLNQIMVNKRANDKAERTKVDVKKKFKNKVNSVTNRVKNFYPNKSKDTKKSYLAIVEGLSALESVLSGRDSEYYAIYALRGKTLNCFKATDKKIIADEVISGLFTILECGMELSGKPGTKSNNFNIDNLRYDRIVLYTDQDVDGNSIVSLVLTALYRLAPQLIKEGHVYIADTPLYEIVDIKEDKTYFAMDKKELEKYKKQLEAKKHKYKIGYNKGLGSLTAEEMSKCMTDTGWNHRQVIIDSEEAIEKLYYFMGKDSTKRKELILDSYKEGIK